MNKYGNHPVTDDARWKSVRKALGRLTIEVDDPWFVVQRAPVLLDLSVVKGSSPDGGGNGRPTDEELVSGLRGLLAELTGDFNGDPQALLLTVVLGLTPTWTDPTGSAHDVLLLGTQARRTLAGRFMRPSKPIGADAIRMNHEQVALDRLGVMLMRREVFETGFKLDQERWIRENLERYLIYLPREIVPQSGTFVARDVDGKVLKRLATCEKGDRFPWLDEDAGEYGWSLQPETPGGVVARNPST